MNVELLRYWFLSNKRDLPWRENPNPYQVLISEVMLQQTQVSVVTDYYYRWMEAFPDVKTLASSDLSQVIKIWEGLGYYSRAKRLHQAAKQITEEFNEIIPNDIDHLLKIKGIGPYTAGAIASFAFKKKAPAIDGNVLRVMTRLFAIETPIDKVVTKKRVYKIVLDLLPEKEPHVIMEGLIELGALICKKSPQCAKCPLNQSCKAFEQNKTDHIPVISKKEQTVHLNRKVYLVIYQQRVLVKEPKEDGKVMGLLYEFPYEEIEKLAFIKTLNEPQYVGELFLKIKHTFTKYKVNLYPEVWRVSEQKAPDGYCFIEKEKLMSLPFSSGHKKIVNYLLQNWP